MSKTVKLNLDRHPLSYVVRTQYATYNDTDIDASLIKDIINSLDGDDFIVMEPSKPISESSYIQAIADKGEPDSIIVELRLQYTDQSFRHYSYQTPDMSAVIRMFLDYWDKQKLPDLTTWTDITDQF